MGHLPVELPGYDSLSSIYESPTALVYRGIRTADRRPVILKSLNPAQVSPFALSRCHHEFEVIRLARAPRVIEAYDLEQHAQTPVLVLEDVGGAPLSRWLEEWRHAGTEAFSLQDFLHLAGGIVEGVAAIHAAGIIHKDISPSNIVFNPRSDTVKIIDFDIASTLRRENPPPKNPRALEGTLEYLAPEQTGRMNRSVDYRADFYSLGATFYELLTGRVPLSSTDAMELVHLHIAKTPEAPHLLNPLVPPALSELALKLLAKAPEDRYQSSAGLLHDLGECARELRTYGRVGDLRLGSRDRSERFLMTEKLYGREPVVAALLDAFGRAADGGAEIILVAGRSGTGKTVVVNEVQKPIVQRRGCFARGKCDPLSRGIPLYCFVQALRDMVGQLLGEDEPQIRQRRETILEAVGESGRVILDVVPELEKIIGPQPPVPELPADAAQNRFHLLVRRFISLFATVDHPLVIYLDDVQWADVASLKMIQLLVGEARVGHFLLVGAYRDNEVPDDHPLRRALDEIQEAGVAVRTVTLFPLGEDTVCRLVADTLGCPAERATPLAALVFQKTRGNPFFIHQFLKTLHADGLVAYNSEVGAWECDIARIGSLALGDDVEEFMRMHVRRLPASTRKTVSLAACIGSSFDLETLAVACQSSQVDTAAVLWPALQAGLVLPEGSAFRFYRSIGPNTDNPFGAGAPAPRYRFLHDHAQSAAYSLISPAQREATHLRIGRLLLRGTPEAQREERIFDLVSHLDRGSRLIRDPGERRALAELNLRAGRKATAATAYRAAAEYYAAARSLLPPDCWEDSHDFTLEVHELSVEAAYLSGDYPDMEALGEVVLKHARSVNDRLRVLEVRITAYAAQHRLLEAVRLGLSALESLGMSLPLTPAPGQVAGALEETRAAYGQRGIAALVDLPPMTDPRQLALMRLLVSISPAAFLSAPDLYTLLILKQVQLSILHGTTAAAAFCYASYGLILCAQVEGIDDGNQFGRLAVDLVNRLGAREWYCKITSIVNTFVFHWKTHVRDTLAPLRAAHFLGLETGDLQFAGYAAVLYSAYAYIPGIEKSLPDLLKEHLALSEPLRQLKQMTAYHYCQMLHQAMHDLMEGRASPHLLSGSYYDEVEMMPRHQETNDRNGIFYVHFHRLLLSAVFGDWRQAARDAAQAALCTDGARGFPYLPIFFLFDSLARLAVFRQFGEGDRDELLRTVEDNQKRLRRWATHAPMNLQYKIDLVEAERQRILGDRVSAMDAYDRAITGAREHGYLRDEAIANELAASFYLERGQEKVARAYLRDAHERYRRWGAFAKVAQIERLPEWRAAAEGDEAPATGVAAWPRPARAGPVPGRTPSGRGDSLLDLGTVMKASAAIGAEIELPRLLKRLIRLAMENAGAQRGALILPRDGAWVIEAQGDIARDDLPVLEGLDVKASGLVAAGIVDSVIQNRASIVIDDAAEFSPDPSLAVRGIKSVLCTPLINQAQLSGVLYLENNLTTYAFSAERLELLSLLSTQMALALDNARLYQQAQLELAERTRAEAALRQADVVIQSSPVVLFRWRAAEDWPVEYVSENIRQFGFSSEELLSGALPYSTLIHPDDRDRVAREVEQHAREGSESFQQEYRIRTRGGAVRWVDDRTTICRDAAGRITVFQGTVMDITDRKRAELALEESEGKFRSLVENALVGVFTIDESFRFIYCNEEICLLLGYSRDELLGMDFRQTLAPTHRGLVADRYRRRQSGESLPPRYEIDVVRRDGQVRHVQLSAVVMHDERGRARTLGQLVDVTERKDAEEQLRRRATELVLFNRIIASSARSADEQGILQTACTELAETFGASHAIAVLLNADCTGAVVVAEHGGGAGSPLMGSSFSLLGPMGTTLRSGPLAIHDLDRDEGTGLRGAPLAGPGVVSVAAIPLVVEGAIAGGLYLTSGAAGYFSAERMDLLKSVANELSGALARTRLQRERLRLSAAAEQSSDAVIITDTQDVIQYSNPSFERLSGYLRSEVTGQSAAALIGDGQDRGLFRAARAAVQEHGAWRGRLLTRRKNGTLFTAEMLLSPVRDQGGQVVNYMAALRDITDELAQEQRTVQAQKMEAIGRLAGGVAHDFNNLLTTLLGHADLLSEQLPPDGPQRADLEQILAAAGRAGGLTRQLLAFSRNQVLQPRELNLNGVIRELNKMLKPMIGEDVTLQVQLDPDLGLVRADPVQVEQVIMNLAVNARDAMPHGGALTLATANVTLSDAYAREHPGSTPGSYVTLAVRDTGVGIAQDALPHVFEPFFTTKAEGRGTGLGLATVYGIVKQSGGYVALSSEPGRGTVVEIYLPRLEGTAAPVEGTNAGSQPVPRGTERILLVEDNELVRRLTRKILANQGYEVTAAESAVEGIATLESRPHGFDLLVTDVVMPGIGGRELARRARIARPDLRVLFISGYADASFKEEAALHEGMAFLQKPYSRQALAQTVRTLLDS